MNTIKKLFLSAAIAFMVSAIFSSSASADPTGVPHPSYTHASAYVEILGKCALRISAKSGKVFHYTCSGLARTILANFECLTQVTRYGVEVDTNADKTDGYAIEDCDTSVTIVGVVVTITPEQKLAMEELARKAELAKVNAVYQRIRLAKASSD